MKQNKHISLVTACLMFFSITAPLLQVAKAASPGDVVINEVAWAGSADSSTDEWIELYNNSGQSVDLTNWHIDDDHGASDYVIVSGTIASHGYFLIEDHESTVSNISADVIIDLSLANTGDSLDLYDSAGQLIDTVNGSGGAWYAGDATSHASMERVDVSSLADDASNWATSTGSGSVSSGGSAIIGTPSAVNSQSVIAPGTASVDLASGVSAIQSGDVLTVTAQVNDVTDLFAYGFELDYDPAVLHLKSSSEKGFLSENGAVATSFQSGLQDGTEGKLLIAGARTVSPKTAVSGNGDLFEVQFDVLSTADTSIQEGNGSFLASTSGDIPASFNAADFTGQISQIPAVTNLVSAPGQQRYSIVLNWDAVSGADGYRVYRKDAHGQMQQIAEITQTTFVDGDGVQNGGHIIPLTNYVYDVTAIAASTESVATEVVGQDVRGLKGDNTRNDLVDGRDLQGLADHFAESDADQGFDPLVDTTYDGRIDGSDLIDLGANFALTYQP